VNDPTAILGRVMLAFEGETLPPWVAERLARAPAAGMTLFRHFNVRSPEQVRELTSAFARAGAALPQAASAPLPLLIAADQEGGQLLALGDGPTPFAGNMALGAVDDEALTERVGAAIGLEAQAMGVNVVYAPVLDLATDQANPALGIRAFGDDPGLVARHGAAMVRGLQSAGVAAAVKHAPGMGAITTDTHHGAAVVDVPRAMLEAREFVPFRAAFAAGVRLAMAGHLALPAITGDPGLPTTLSRAVLTDLLRRDLGFAGVTISDALDMGAIVHGTDATPDVAAAVRAGVDLLLATPGRDALARIEAALVEAAARGVFDPAELAEGDRRVRDLRAWLATATAGGQPGLEVVGRAEHARLAEELAARSITLVRDPRHRLPIDPARRSRILAIMPRPTDLTPADTSSLVPPGLAAALRRHHAQVDEVVVEPEPDDPAIAALRERARGVDVVVAGTIDAHRMPAQLAMIEALADTGMTVIAVALRGPWDVTAYPASVTALATYSILSGSLDALAAAISGRAGFPGRLPVRVPGMPGVPTSTPAG
jgi:beta-N-acetylhexosaminidase